MLLDIRIAMTTAEAGRRLDAVVLARCPTSARALVQRAIAAGDVTVNGQPVHKGLKLVAGDTVVVARLDETADVRVAPDAALPLEVIFTDDDLVAVNKPAGMDVQPLRPEETGTLANALVARWPEMADVGDQPLAAGVVHRIDGDTSGLVLAARQPAAFAALRVQFAAQTVQKEYVALVAGVVSQPAELVHDLVHQPWRRGRMVDARRLRAPGRLLHAVTAFRPQRRVGAYTLLDVTIFTGVTHQIRCQLALAGHPIVGDALYGGPAVSGFNRHFLHAAAVSLRHPRTRALLRLEAPLTPDLTRFLETARVR